MKCLFPRELIEEGVAVIDFSFFLNANKIEHRNLKKKENLYLPTANASRNTMKHINKYEKMRSTNIATIDHKILNGHLISRKILFNCVVIF